MVKKPIVPKPIPKTREVILKLAAERGMDEKTFLQAIKDNKCNGPFNEKNWSKYVQVIRNYGFIKSREVTYSPYDPCPICGSRQIQDGKLVTLYRLMGGSGIRCEKDIHHFYLVLEARRQEKAGTRTYEEAIEILKQGEVNE